MNETYLSSVRLLLRVAPYVFDSDAFVLKGGTAINLFVCDMPRLSVDLDLVYRLHTNSREKALADIGDELRRIQAVLHGEGFDCEPVTNSEGNETKIFVQDGRSRIKVEINHVFRGSLHPPILSSLKQEVEDRFAVELNLPLLIADELYGSKLVAAMDRQHPRDLFDVLGLYESSGLTKEIVDCFVGYLAGHNRPVHEVLFATKIDMSQAYTNEFSGMTVEPVALERLMEVRQQLFEELPRRLGEAQRSFLMSLVKAEPEWDLMPFPHLKEMPAIRWKLRNLEKLRSANPLKFKEQSDQLRRAFENIRTPLT